MRSDDYENREGKLEDIMENLSEKAKENIIMSLMT